MQYLIIIFAAAAVMVNGLTQGQKDRIRTLSKECITETGVDKEILKKVRVGIIPDDEKLEDFTFCLFKKLGLQNENGEILVDFARSKLPDELSEAEKDNIAKTCLSKKGATYGKTALIVYKCYRELSPVNYGESL